MKLESIATAWAAALLVCLAALAALSVMQTASFDEATVFVEPAPPSIEAIRGNERWVERGLLDPLPASTDRGAHEAEHEPVSEPFFQVWM